MNKPKVIKEKDSWYNRMRERTPENPNEYPFVGLLEWVYMLFDWKN